MRVFFIQSKPLVLASLCLCSWMSHAQSEWVQGKETVVVGQLLREPLSEVLPSVSVISLAEIQRAPARDLFELINGLPGVEVTRTGPMGSPTTVSMRGGSSAQTLVLVDGMPISAQSAIGAIAPLEAIPLGLVQRVEILRGNATAQYGPGAVGGVINISTLADASELPQGTKRATASGTWGCFGERQLAAGWASKADGNALTLMVGKSQTRGYNAMVPSTYTDAYGTYSANPGPNGYANEYYNLGWTRTLSAQTEFGLKLSRSHLNSQFDNLYADYPTDVWENKSQLDLWSVYAKHSLSADWVTRLQYSDSMSKQSTYTNGAFNASYGSFNTHYKNWSWDHTYALSTAHTASFGLALNNIQLNLNHLGYLADYSTIPVTLSPALNTSRVYGGVASQWQRWNTQLTLSKDQLGQGYAADHFLMGAGYALGGGYKLTATRSSALLAPTVGQRYDASYGGNPALMPERSYANEAGIQFQGAAANWRLVAFQVDYQNLISSGTHLVSDPFWSSQNIKQLENIGQSRNKGHEFSSSTRWGPWSLGLNLTWQSPENLNTDLKPINKAGRFGSVRAGYDLSAQTKLTWMTYMTSDRFTISPSPSDSAASPSRASGYALHHFSAIHQWDPNWTGKFSLMNVFDKTYSPIVGYAPQPRTWLFTMTYQSH